MSGETYLSGDGEGVRTFSMGNYSGIESPVYIPEIKGAEGLRALLDHTEVLDEKSPVMVPAAKWEALRKRRIILNRTNEDGDEVGESEVQELEESHPLVYYDPPELYNYKRTKTLTNYLFKQSAWDSDVFERKLREEKYSEAIEELPKFHRPFLRANLNKVIEETEGASTISSDRFEESTPEEAWASLSSSDYESYFDTIGGQANERESSVVVPPVPQMSKDWNEELVTAWCSSNSAMESRLDGAENADPYFHLYLDYQAWDPDAADDTAAKCLEVMETELEESDYAGIAITVHQPNRIWQQNRAARMRTFMDGVSRVGNEQGLPVILPRSEWFGSYVTDSGIQAYSSLLNGAWQYQAYNSGGGPTGADRYGRTMVLNDARALKLRSDSAEDLEGYLEAENGLPEVDNLPSMPPTYNPDGGSLKEKFGTAPEFRRTFGKPRRLAHAEEARQFRNALEEGESNPAREYLKESNNPYIEI